MPRIRLGLFLPFLRCGNVFAPKFEPEIHHRDRQSPKFQKFSVSRISRYDVLFYGYGGCNEKVKQSRFPCIRLDREIGSGVEETTAA